MGKVRGFKNRLEPFGATKARGKGFAKERKLLNRIHELEQQVAALERREAVAHARAIEAERLEIVARPTPMQLAALRAISNLTANDIVELNLVQHAIVLTNWFRALNRPVTGIFKLAKPIIVPPRADIVETKL